MMHPNFFKLMLKQAMMIPGFIGLILLSGCVSTSTQNETFYTLESQVASPLAQAAKPAIFIDLLPIKMPEYLKRPQIVTHAKDSAQVNILEQSRWASPFNHELQDALSASIAQQTNAAMTLRGSQETGVQTYRLAITLLQLNAYANDYITASFSWSLTSINEDTSLKNTINCQFNANEALSAGTEGVVKGTQVIVQELTAQIAGAVDDLRNQRVAQCGD